MATTLSAGPAVPSADTFKRRYFHSSVVLSDFVYIDGGVVIHSTPENIPVEYLMRNTISLPLNASWSNDTVKFKVFDPATAFTFSRSSFWSDKSADTAYRVGGFTPVHVAHPLLYKLKPDGSGGGTWSEAEQPPWVDYDLGVGLSANSKSTGFYYGGYSATENKLFYNLNEYDFDTGTWTKQYNRNSPGSGTQSGSAVYVPNYGPEGLLVMFGGVTVDRRTQKASGTSLGNVTIYDPSSKTWHRQSTSGEIPSYRTKFCTIGVPGPQGTFEIFIYGGDNTLPDQLALGEGVITYYDIYILSIPSFRWFLVPQFTVSRTYHTCELVGERQMLSIGGIDGISTTQKDDYLSPDPFRQGLGVFDLVDLTWKSRYDADAPGYTPPRLVQRWYNRANVESVDWTSQAVRDLIDSGLAKANPFASFISPDSPSVPNIPRPGNDSSSIGAIVGAAVGSLALICIVAGLIIWIVRRRQQRQLKAQTDDQANAWWKPELAGTELKRYELSNSPFPGAELDMGEVLELEPEARVELGAVEILEAGEEERHELEPEARLKIGEKGWHKLHERGRHELGNGERQDLVERALHNLEVPVGVYELDAAPREQRVSELEEKTTIREVAELKETSSLREAAEPKEKTTPKSGEELESNASPD